MKVVRVGQAYFTEKKWRTVTRIVEQTEKILVSPLIDFCKIY